MAWKNACGGSKRFWTHWRVRSTCEILLKLWTWHRHIHSCTMPIIGAQSEEHRKCLWFCHAEVWAAIEEEGLVAGQVWDLLGGWASDCVLPSSATPLPAALPSGCRLSHAQAPRQHWLKPGSWGQPRNLGTRPWDTWATQGGYGAGAMETSACLDAQGASWGRSQISALGWWEGRYSPSAA